MNFTDIINEVKDRTKIDGSQITITEFFNKHYDDLSWLIEASRADKSILVIGDKQLKAYEFIALKCEEAEDFPMKRKGKPLTESEICKYLNIARSKRGLAKKRGVAAPPARHSVVAPMPKALNEAIRASNPVPVVPGATSTKTAVEPSMSSVIVAKTVDQIRAEGMTDVVWAKLLDAKYNIHKSTSIPWTQELADFETILYHHAPKKFLDISDSTVGKNKVGEFSFADIYRFICRVKKFNEII
ncbi:hypothetical protein [Herbaspirillum sp. ST 5-3]|uniref:hypothetical protein n=1 Tax=Oxalobacteraceae TaxID=75682 RepID=UPI0010A2F48F|nr:hypothetical protein [Herbaspirillum sp. ST 5-3]